MAPASIRMVLVEGEGADGVTIEEDSFGTTADAAALSPADQVISAILGTREGAAEGGCQLTSTGVTWTDPVDAAALRDALATRKVNNVMLVSAFLAAAALAQTVGNATNYAHIALLYVEPGTATVAVVDCDDGSVEDVQRRALQSPDVTAELATMVAGLDSLQSRPNGLFVVGSGVDVASTKPALEAATRLPVSVPEEPDLALARGAALASANAPLFASSTAALAYAQDPGTGEVNPFAVAPGYFEVAAGHTGVDQLAYSAEPDEDADTDTALAPTTGGGEIRQERRPLVLVGTALAAIVAVAALATVVTLAINVQETVALLPWPVAHLIVPAQQAPAAHIAAPHPPAVHLPAPAAPAHLPIPAAPPHLPIPAAPPLPILAAPAPLPMPMPMPMPVRVPVPVVQAPQPAVNLSFPMPFLQTPTPPLNLTTPPAHPPTPLGHLPQPPAHPPTPPRHLPQPRMHLPAPQPPMRMPTRATPLRLPGHTAPMFPRMPAPRMPRMGAPMFPRMGAPMMPRMPAPRMPRLGAPMFPRLGAPMMPRFNFRMPAFRL